MRTCAIIINKKKAGAYEHMSNAKAWLEARGIVCYTEGDNTPRPELIKKQCDFLLVLGGDGTMLDVSHEASRAGTPVLGINLGAVGYLTDAEPPQMISALMKLLNGDFIIENRMMIRARLNGDTRAAALNEISVSKGADTHMITFDILINNAYINTYRADGVIIATPTGSTAYNLSAGGPILKPDGDMIAITPICPHGLFALPCVVSGRDIITIKLPENCGEANLYYDGKHISPLKPNDSIEVSASDTHLKIIKTNNHSFFDVLRIKL